MLTRYTPISLYEALFGNGDEHVSKEFCDLLDLSYRDVLQVVVIKLPTNKTVSLGIKITLEQYDFKTACVTRIGRELDELLPDAFDSFYWVITHNEKADSLWLTINGLRGLDYGP